MNAEALVVRIAGTPVGTLFYESHTFSFRYDDPRELDERRQLVSLTMPVRARAYETQMLPPPFQAVLPEGELLIRLRARYGKVIVVDDDFALLRLVGRHTVGRLTFVEPGEAAESAAEAPFDLASALRHPDAREVFAALVERYGLRFGIGGIQPKALLEHTAVPTDRAILKLAGADYPQLPVNEHFCLRASRAAGIATAESTLSDNREILAVHRFDRDAAGRPLALEEMCALLQLARHGKYSGSYEEIARVVRQIPCTDTQGALRELLASVALSMTIRNGDAHLRNYGVLYDRSDFVGLAPAYDLVTTTVYVAQDQPALALGGRKLWPEREAIVHFGLHACNLRRATVRRVLDRVADAVGSTRKELLAFAKSEPAYRALAQRMVEQWDAGLRALV